MSHQTARVIDQFVRSHGFAFLQDGDRQCGLSLFRIGRSNHSHIENRRMGRQRLLDFATANVLAVGNDHVFLTIDKKKIPFHIEVADIAGSDETILNCSERRRVVVPIAHQTGIGPAKNLARRT